VGRMARASRARASAATGTPEECVSIWTTLVHQFSVELTVAAMRTHASASATIDTQVPHANKPPNHVVQQYPPAVGPLNQCQRLLTELSSVAIPTATTTPAATPAAATPAAAMPPVPSTGATPIAQVGTAFASRHADVHQPSSRNHVRTWLATRSQAMYELARNWRGQ
jgi:hypothetical protein